MARVLDARDVMCLQVVVQAALTAEVAASGGQVTDDQRLCPGAEALIVLLVDAVVADQGVGHDHALAGVRGVGEDLLIAHHGGVEDHLTDPILCAANAGANKGLSVFQYQRCLHIAYRPSFVAVQKTGYV